MITWIPSDVLFSIGGVTIYWYGLCVALGIAVAYTIGLLILRRYAKHSEKHFDRVFFLTFFFGVIGARVTYVLYHLDYFRVFPHESIALWHGGWVWHGGIVAGVLAAYLYCRRYRLSFWTFADASVPGVLLGQAIGRIGNYFNQEAYGLPTSLPWGLPIDPVHRIEGYAWATHFHPTFAYEMILNILLFACLYPLVKQALTRQRTTVRGGTVFCIYLFGYSFGRFLIEFLRIDSVPVVLGLRAPQWASILLLLWAGYYLLQRRKNLV